jgi:hypothetical protein
VSRNFRKERAKRAPSDLEVLQGKWKSEAAGSLSDDASHARRERCNLLEAETAVLRLLQAESRLLQQLVLGVGGFVSGSLMTLLLKHLLEG